jgi:hypothetical protein
MRCVKRRILCIIRRVQYVSRSYGNDQLTACWFYGVALACDDVPQYDALWLCVLGVSTILIVVVLLRMFSQFHARTENAVYAWWFLRQR